jgi:hypothetical protein
MFNEGKIRGCFNIGARTQVWFHREARNQFIPVLVYLADNQAYSLPPDDDPKLTSLKDEVLRMHGVSWFTSPADLAAKIASDLARDFSHLMSAGNDLKERVDELIAILEDRADKIREGLQQYYHHILVRDYLEKFQRLHERHIDSLRNGRIIQAHEILSQIHSLSHDLDSKGFWTGNTGLYCLSMDAFERGALICEYVGGEMKSRSKKYPINVGIKTWHIGRIPRLTNVYQVVLGNANSSTCE